MVRHPGCSEYSSFGCVSSAYLLACMLACSRALKQYAYSATSMQMAAATSMYRSFVFPVCAVPQQQREECTVRAPGRGQGSHQLAEDTGALQAAGAATHMHVSHPVSSNAWPRSESDLCDSSKRLWVWRRCQSQCKSLHGVWGLGRPA